MKRGFPDLPRNETGTAGAPDGVDAFAQDGLVGGAATDVSGKSGAQQVVQIGIVAEDIFRRTAGIVAANDPASYDATEEAEDAITEDHAAHPALTESGATESKSLTTVLISPVLTVARCNESERVSVCQDCRFGWE